jgi:hypothetical protein
VDCISRSSRSRAWSRQASEGGVLAPAGQAQKRFYQLAEELPDWELDQPAWLFLTESQREGLLRLGIVSAFESSPRPADP